MTKSQVPVPFFKQAGEEGQVRTGVVGDSHVLDKDKGDLQVSKYEGLSHLNLDHLYGEEYTSRMFSFLLRMMACSVLFLWQVGVGFSIENDSNVKGTVLFSGKVPRTETRAIQIDASVCGNVAQLSKVQVHTQTLGLQDAVVSVQGVPLSNTTVLSSEPVVRNVQCLFTPRVLATRRGETLAIHNRDPILHNTHITVEKRTVFNVAQVAGSRPITKILKHAGLHAVRCDKHTFMSGMLQVFDHPYFAVTDESGVFHIPNLPPGRYTLVVWHETLGSMEQEITVPPHGVLTVNFEYS